MTERTNFKKPSRPEPKPFQVTLDFQSGVKLGLGIALVQVVFVLVQVGIGAIMALVFSN